jgi:protein TonB
MLLERTAPEYPAVAKAARVSGTVVLQATISKTGAIENLRVISGPPLLQDAAMDAVKTWRYRPYLLNGEPVEVETTVNVVFALGE